MITISFYCVGVNLAASQGIPAAFERSLISQKG